MKNVKFIYEGIITPIDESFPVRESAIDVAIEKLEDELLDVTGIDGMSGSMVTGDIAIVVDVELAQGLIEVDTAVKKAFESINSEIIKATVDRVVVDIYEVGENDDH